MSESILLYRQDMGMDRKVDSAWGARGQMTHSADSNDGLGGDLTNDGTGTRDDAPPDSQSDDQGAWLCNSLRGRDLGTRQSGIGNVLRKIGPYRSVKGNMSRAA